ncbi:MAG: hypothetical protein HZA32_18330 [Opitutae bacterium]|nr:hypothetical protein [Opitutae bacterium]
MRTRAFLVGGSTTQENGICEIAGRSSGTNGVAVADDTSRFTTDGGNGGQLPPAGGDASAELASRGCGGD